MKVYKDLQEERSEIRDKIEKLIDSKGVFEEFINQFSWFEDKGIFWRVFYQTVDDLKHKEEAIDKEMKELGKDCDHMWEPAGYDSHYSYEECAICGKMEKV